MKVLPITNSIQANKNKAKNKQVVSHNVVSHNVNNASKAKAKSLHTIG